MGAPPLCSRFWVPVKPDMVASKWGPLPACGSLPGSQVLEGSRHWTGRVQALQRPSRTADPGLGRPLRPEGPACDRPAPASPRPLLLSVASWMSLALLPAARWAHAHASSCTRHAHVSTHTGTHGHTHTGAGESAATPLPGSGACRPSGGAAGRQELRADRMWRLCLTAHVARAGREEQGRSSPGEGSGIPAGSWRLPWATAAWLPPGECCHLVGSWTQRLQAREE